jgi:hypothetical protein
MDQNNYVDMTTPILLLPYCGSFLNVAVALCVAYLFRFVPSSIHSSRAQLLLDSSLQRLGCCLASTRYTSDAPRS